MAKILPKINKTILNKSFVSISKAAKFLQVSPDTLRNWEREGKLLPARTYGGARRYNSTELLNLKKEIHPFAARKKGLVSVSQAAKALHVSSDTLRNWDKKGLIESTRSKGGARRFTRDEIKRLQKELGIEPVAVSVQQEIKELPQPPKSSQEVHRFSISWIKIIFPLSLMMLLLATGWFISSYISPLEEKIDETSKLTAGIVASIESLQKGVLGIQSQPTPSPIVFFDDNRVNIIDANLPIILDSSSGQISCPSCLTASLVYISSLTNSDGSLGISLNDKEAKVSLNLDHANSWLATQSFKGGIEVGTSPNPVVVTAGGNVGIGVTTPINKLDVAGGQTIGVGYAGSYTAPSNGLLIQGNVGIGVSAPSYHLDVAGGARFGCGDSVLSNGPTSSCSDIAEVYQSDGSVGLGEIVAVSKQSNIVTKSSTAYQKGMIGVYSTSPGLLVGGQTILGSSGNLGGNNIPVALAGRAPVKVSDENGLIQVGDYLTSSSIPGVAMKAIRPGPVIGQALEPFDVPDLSDQPVSQDHHLVDIRLKFGRILIFVNISFADPSNFFASLTMDNQGNLIIPKLKAGSITLDPSLAAAASQVAISNNQTSASLSAGTSLEPVDFSGEVASLEDRVKGLESRVKEQKAEISRLSTLAINNFPAGNVGIGVTSFTKANPTPVVILAEATAAAIIASDSAVPNTSDSQRLRPEDLLNLTPPDILLVSSSATTTPISVTKSLSSDKLFTDEDREISGNLSVFGKATLASTTIAGDFTVDGTLSVNGNSVNVIGSPTCLENKAVCGILYLQSSPLAFEVNFFNGLVTIDKTGNLRAQTVTVAEFKVIANKISGSGKISAGTKSVDIENTQVELSSRILITPNSETNLVLAVTGKTEGEKFTVSVAQTAPEDIIFDWFIINESPEF